MMIINTINSAKSNLVLQPTVGSSPPKYSLKQNINKNTLCSDVFVKSSNLKTQNLSSHNYKTLQHVSFGGGNLNPEDSQSFEEFKKWAEKTDFLSNARDIAERTGKILGRGFEGVTYEIPDNDNWVLKEYKRSNFLKLSKENPEIIEINDISPKLNLGQVIARIDIPSGNKQYCYVYYILKKQHGQGYGVSNRDADSIDRYTKAIHLSELKKAAKLPQSAFDKCVKDVQYITNIRYLIDFNNPNNIMLDTDKNEINFVDISDRLMTDSNQQAEVLFSLLDAELGVKYRAFEQEQDNEKESEELTNIIVEKYFAAMKNNGIKFSGDFIYELLDTGLLDGNVKGNTNDEKIAYLRKNNLF